MKKDVQVVVDVRDMRLRKLHKEEHIRTRSLWERIFTEDTPEFLDYYYSVKTKENEIYVIEDGEEIVSMLHLNPYQMRIKNKIYQTHYIVAVATDERYRKQGLMRQLLNHAMQVMRDRGEPFTFLMPASEAIYKPFGFEFIYEQKKTKLVGRSIEDVSLECIKATEKDCKEIACFANKFLKDYDVVCWRTEAYYKRLLSEFASEDGGVLIVKRDNVIQGLLGYARGEQLQILEPLFYDTELLQHVIYYLTGNSKDEVLCIGYGEETKPMIMAKVLDAEFNMDLKKAKVFLNEVV